MTKIRVYELAKELGMESKDVIRRLGKMGEEVKNHMSTVEDKHANMLRDIMRPKLADEMNKEKVSDKKDAPSSAPEATKPQAKSEDAPAKAEHHDESPVNAAKESNENQSEKVIVKKEEKVEPVKPAEEKPHIHTERAETDQPRQQGVFQKRNDQP
ncbi:MAG: translation initiation factor IF-2 N-terminal domain-containing protein, partial [Bacillota bacterium]|nr:translation initiation factor IF-2 N-terminal domain-containing protein [Bacillota bacterium]